MSWKSVLAIVVVLVVSATLARAQDVPGVQLRFHDGLVTLSARNAPLRAILAEWARLGGATIVNGENVVGPPLTLELNAVPERQALDTLLRSVSGYLLGTRTAGTPGAAVFDRILILPTSSAPQNPPPNPAGGFQGQRPMFPRPGIMDDPEPGEAIEEFPPEDIPADDDVPVSPVVRPRQPGGFPQPMVVPQPEPEEEFEPEFEAEPEDVPEPEEEPSSTTPSSSSPFGLPPGTTARPGIVTPVPEQQQRGVPRGDPDP